MRELKHNLKNKPIRITNFCDSLPTVQYVGCQGLR